MSQITCFFWRNLFASKNVIAFFVVEKFQVCWQQGPPPNNFQPSPPALVGNYLDVDPGAHLSFYQELLKDAVRTRHLRSIGLPS